MPNATPATVAQRSKTGAAGGDVPPGTLASARPTVSAPPSSLVETLAAAEHLAEYLLDDARRRPVVVLSVESGRSEPWFDVPEIVDYMGGLADVVVLRTGAASWRLADLLPDGTQVYGGAARIYPAGTQWAFHSPLAPLFFCYAEQDIERVTRSIAHRAAGMAAPAYSSQEPTPRSRPAQGSVKSFVDATRALVELETGEVATICQELVVPEVAIEQILRPRQPVHGAFDASTGRLDIRTMIRPAQEALAHYGPGQAVLARVSGVEAASVRLALYPEVDVDVHADRVTSNERDSLTDLFTVGETVVARIDSWGAGGPTLRLDDIDDDEEPAPAPALTAAGPPWLELPAWDAAPADEADQQTSTLTRPRPDPAPAAGPTAPEAVGAPTRGGTPPVLRGPGGPPTPAQAFGRAPADGTTPPPGPPGMPGASSSPDLQALRERARYLESRVHELETKVGHQRTALRKEKHRAQLLARAGREREPQAAAVPDRFFLDPAEQFRHEVLVEWVERIPAGQKEENALADYRLLPEFLPSLTALHGLDRRKVVQVTVEVLTGLAERLDGRVPHMLRESSSGGSGAVVRSGWTCWRVALERETPAARRLHYWRRGNEFELSRVVLHDDMAP